jgi:hypothetical protein
MYSLQSEISVGDFVLTEYKFVPSHRQLFPIGGSISNVLVYHKKKK